MKPIASIVVEACYIYKVHTIQGHRKFQQPSLRILCRCKAKHQLLVKKNKSLSNKLLVFCTATITSDITEQSSRNCISIWVEKEKKTLVIIWWATGF